jgi:peptidyl-prolyl cis-trans isomerase SurA
VLRTSITMTVAAAGAVALLSACGSVQMGAAAITGSQRISAATLTNEVANLDSAYQASNGAIQLQFPKSQAPQEVLSWLVRFGIRDEMAARNGITVTPAQSQQALASVRAQAQQNHLTLPQLGVANGLPPDLLPALGRYQAIEVALVSKLDGGKLPSSSSALSALGQRFNTMQCRAAKSLDIRINPQFGQLDYGQLLIVPAPLTLSAPQIPSPPPSPKPQLTAPS